MTWSIDPPIKTSEGMLFAVSDHHCAASSCAGVIWGKGRKTPSVIILLNEGQVRGVDFEGRQLAAAEIERRYPGILKTIANAH